MDPELREYIVNYIRKFGTGTSFMRQVIKEQLRIYLQRKELYKVPFISGTTCLNN